MRCLVFGITRSGPPSGGLFRLCCSNDPHAGVRDALQCVQLHLLSSIASVSHRSMPELHEEFRRYPGPFLGCLGRAGFEATGSGGLMIPDGTTGSYRRLYTDLCKAPIPGICDALRRYSTSRFRYGCEAPRHYEVSARFEIVITARAGLYRLRVLFAEDTC